MALTYETRKIKNGANGSKGPARVKAEPIIKKAQNGSCPKPKVKDAEFYLSLIEHCTGIDTAIKSLKQASEEGINDLDMYLGVLKRCKKEVDSEYALKVVAIAIKADVEDLDFYKAALDDCIIVEDNRAVLGILSKASELFDKKTPKLKEEDLEIAEEGQRRNSWQSSLALFEHVCRTYAEKELDEELMKAVDTAFKSKIEYLEFYEEIRDYYHDRAKDIDKTAKEKADSREKAKRVGEYISKLRR
jgi:hypothetical protein